MPNDALRNLCEAARKKVAHTQAHPLSYFVSCMMAGAYVSVGVCLAFAIGGPLAAANSPFLKLAMGGSFAVALSLVIFAGAELFTGNALTMSVGCWNRRVSVVQLLRIWGFSWVGNLIGGILLGTLLYFSGVLNAQNELSLVQQITHKKILLSIPTLLVRGLLCNWLVCIAVWCSYRMSSESGKLIMTFWCMYAFFASGFEHSIANMTIFTLALFQMNFDKIMMMGMGYNLLWVTIGNIVGGALFVAGAYMIVSQGTCAIKPSDSQNSDKSSSDN